jgi:transcriptional regulator with XRE-family HTH domain
VEGVNLVAGTGLGSWLRARREKLGLSQREAAQSADIGERTLQRYEKDAGPNYELLRLLDALGVRLRPSPPRGSAGSLNSEFRRLSDRQGVLEAEVREAVALMREALERLSESPPQAGEEHEAQSRGG